MDIDWIREYCLALPHTTEKVQWGNDLVFKIGEKMYAVVALTKAGLFGDLRKVAEESAGRFVGPEEIERDDSSSHERAAYTAASKNLSARPLRQR